MLSRDLYFGFPQGAYLLIGLIPLLCLQLFLFYYRHRQLSLYALNPTLSRLLVSRPFLLSAVKIGALSLAWLFACLALMDPQGNLRYLPFQAEQQPQSLSSSSQHWPHEVLLLVDTSTSMAVSEGQGQNQTRLDQAKAIMDDLVAQLKGPTVSLYSFTSILTPVVPATYDYLFTRLMIRSLSINYGDIGGTQFAPVLTQLKDKVFSSPQPKLYTLILFSDGGDNEVEKLDGQARQQAIQAILSALPHSDEFHFRLFTVGMGSTKPFPIPHVVSDGKPVYSRLDPLLLEKLAQINRGKYYAAQSWTSWNLAHELNRQILDASFNRPLPPLQSLERKVSLAKQDEMLSDLYYQIPLGFALLLLLITKINNRMAGWTG